MKTNYFPPIVNEVAMEPMTVLQVTEPATPIDPVESDPAPGRTLYV